MKTRARGWKVLLAVLLPAVLLLGSCTPAEPAIEDTAIPTQAEEAQIANPASENCREQGGTLTIETRGDGGQYGVCYFEDNRQCEEWALLRGDCPVGGVKVTGYVTQAGRYCAITGGEYAVTTGSGTDDEQGACTLKDGTQCDAWEYYNGTCAAATPVPADWDIQPLSMEVCDGQAQAMSHALGDLVPTVSEEPLSDWVNELEGAGCQATITGTGAQLESVPVVMDALGGMLEEQGWTQDTALVADGPTGSSRGYRKGDQICLASAMWKPDESADCPADQPISACDLKPEQQLYTVTLNCGVKRV